MKRAIVAMAGLGLVLVAWALLDRPRHGEKANEPLRPPNADAARTVAGGAVTAPTVAGRDAFPAPVPARRAVLPTDPSSPAQGCADDGFERCAFLDPGLDALAEMARCGLVRYELPANPDGERAKRWLDEADLSESERVEVRGAMKEVDEAVRRDLAALAVESGMDPAWAESSSSFLLWGTLEQELDEDSQAEAARALAEARRDGTPPALADTIAGRTLSTMAGLGQRLEDAVAERVGPERAEALHAQADGWPGVRRNTRSLCGMSDEEAERVDPLRPANEAEAMRCLEDFEGEGCAFLEPDPLTAELMARCGVVRIEMPTFVMTRTAEPAFDDAWAEGLDLTDAERDAIAQIGETARDALYAELVRAAVDVGGKDEAWAEQTPLLGLFKAALEGVGDDPSVAIAAQVARERAGHPKGVVPDVPPALEAMQRALIDFGADFERRLAERLGPERARALRAHADGWPGNRTQSNPQCESASPNHAGGGT